MPKKPPIVLPLASALAALGGSAGSTAPAKATVVAPAETPAAESERSVEQWNRFIAAGEDILGFTVTEHADGTIVAAHGSHYSHSSHASHASHVSSRY